MNAKTCVFAHDECRNTGKNQLEYTRRYSLYVYYSLLCSDYPVPPFALCFLGGLFSATFMYAGQCIGQISSKIKHLEPKLVIKKIIEGWFNEHKDADVSYIENFHHAPNGVKIGHFTQLVRDEAFAMGCAMTQFERDSKYTTIYTCDYTLSNIDDYPIYEAAEEAASGCQTPVNEKYTGLCGIEEIYDNELFYNFP